VNQGTASGGFGGKIEFVKQLMQTHVLTFEFFGYFRQEKFPDLAFFLEFVESIFIRARCLLAGFRPFHELFREVAVIQRV
jgi:hypothetical protein